MASNSIRRSSSAELLHDLQTLNESLSQSTISRRRHASVTFPSSNPTLDQRRHSISQLQKPQALQIPQLSPLGEQKRGIRNWKPIRMLSHIGMRRISCLFSVEILAISKLPESMNGERLTVGIRKRDSRDGSARAMPSRVFEGCAEFDETLFIQCNVYCSGGAATGKMIKFEPRPFLISVIRVDSAEIELGSAVMDLSQLIRESIEGSLEGARIRKWDAALELSGKGEGGELALRLGFQIMDDGGVGVYNRVAEMGKVKTKGLLSFSPGRARRKSVNSFSVSALDSRVRKMPVLERMEVENFDVEEFQIFGKGTELGVGEEDCNEVEKGSALSGEVVKEVVHNRVEKQFRLMELDSIANEIKDLESLMSKNLFITTNEKEKDEKKDFDASEETVTREFIQMLDAEANGKQLKDGMFDEQEENLEAKALLPGLGNGWGPVIQTKDGGFIASMNPFNEEITRNEPPKLALHISKPFVLQEQRISSGLEVLQRLAAVGLDKLSSKLTLMAAMDELLGKTAGQIAIEGIASAIISGRNKEGASSVAAKSIGAVRRMISAMSEDRMGRNLNEKWRVKEDSILLEEILAFSIQKIEGMALEALKVQADMAEKEASFDVSPLAVTDDPCKILDSAIALDEVEKTNEENKRLLTLLVIIQLRDPARQYEAVGAPLIALIQAIRANDVTEDEEETRYKVISIHVGGLKMRSGEKGNSWDLEKTKLTATQWLVTNGMGKQGKKSKPIKSKLQQDLLWSLSSIIMEDMWLSPVRNPDVKIAK